MEARGEGFEAITLFFEIWLGTESKGGKMCLFLVVAELALGRLGGREMG